MVGRLHLLVAADTKADGWPARGHSARHAAGAKERIHLVADAHLLHRLHAPVSHPNRCACAYAFQIVRPALPTPLVAWVIQARELHDALGQTPEALL